MTRKSKQIIAADLFCGAGGTSTGLRQACERQGVDLTLIAVNHWEIAISTHTANHPEANHHCVPLESIDPRKLVPGGRLNLMVASPECTHHSIARGGKPIHDQSRASAWRIVEWCSQITVDHVLIENVKEFRTWGPLGVNNRPLKRRRGETYFAFLNALRALGYTVEDKILNAADFGDPTSRQRLFIQARRGKKPIVWPEPTHSPALKPKLNGNGNGHRTLFDVSLKRQPYRTAREIIDWDLPSESIFTRKRPLSPNTMARIVAGLRKFCGLPFVCGAGGPQYAGKPRSVDKPMGTVLTDDHSALIQPFLVKFYGGHDAQSVDDPLPAITANYEHYGLAQPFIVELRGGQNGRSLDEPLTTIATSGAHHALCQPFVMVNRNNNTPKSLDEPLPALCTGNHMYLIKPFIIPVNHGRNDKRSHNIEAPMPSITSVDAWGLIQPFIIGMEHGGHERSIDRPLNTITTARGGAHGLVHPFIVKTAHKGGNGSYTYPLDSPLSVVTGQAEHALIQPYLVKYNGTAGAQSVDDPLDTVTAKDRFGIVMPELKPGDEIAVLDIHFRMLQPHELAAAMGFPKTYHFTGNREQKVKQIGNAVPVGLAQALCEAIIGDRGAKA